MKFLTVLLYFFLAIVFLASIGVSLPYVFDKLYNEPNITKNLNQNLVTYFIAILVSASLDYIMRLVDDKVSYKKVAFLCVCLFNFIIFLMTAYILYENTQASANKVSYLTILGVFLAYATWWFVNYNNSTFDYKTGAMGGDTNKEVKNG
jgi:hypothetical protein